MYVQLTVRKQLDIDGRSRTYHPGDWVRVGKQSALQWIAQGQARTAEPVKMVLPPGCAVLLRRDAKGAMDPFRKLGLEIRWSVISNGDIQPKHARTLLWDPSVPPRMEILLAGFGFLDRWQMAAPLWSYDKLACDVGSQADRERTKALVHDLRIPLYETNLLFLRRCDETERVLSLWRQECQDGDERLAFLRAVYQVKPLILALPMTWIKGR
jgi:hypothetical protein